MRDRCLQRLRFDPVNGFSFAVTMPRASGVIGPDSCVAFGGLPGFEVRKNCDARTRGPS